MEIARRIVDFSLGKKSWILAAWIASLVFSIWGLTKLTVSSDNRVFYSDRNSSFVALKAMENKYLPNHNISFLLSSESENDGSSSQLLEAVTWLSQEAWVIENVIRVDSIDNYPIAREGDDNSFVISTLIENRCETEPKCRPNSTLQEPPIGVDRRLVSQDRKSLAVSLSLELEQSDTNQIQRIMSDVDKVVSQFKNTFPRTEIHYTGGIPMMQAFSIAAEEDSTKLAPFTIIAILGIAALMTGSFAASVNLLMAGVSSAMLTLGTAGHFGHVVNPATSVASIMIITLVVTSAMHYVASYINDSRLYDSYRATVNATRVNLRPIALATITSVAGFLSLLFADAPPIGQLGLLAASGVLVGSIHIFLLGPIFLKFLPTPKAQNLAQKISLAFSRVNYSNSRAVALSMTLVLIACGALNLKINDDFIGYFDPSYKFRQDTDFVTKNLSGPNHLEIDVVSHANQSVFRKDYLKEIELLANFLRKQEGVANVFSIVDVFEQIEPLFEVSQFEATTDELSQFYLAFELSLREGQSASDYISRDHQSTRVSLILGPSDSTSIRHLMAEIETWSKSNLVSRTVVTGENAPVAYLTPTNFKSMSIGIIASLILAAIIVAGTLGSIKLAGICFASTAAPIAIGFGLWGWVFGEIGLASVVVLAVTIGIVIDDAIHMISRYEEIRESGAEYSTAIEQTVRIAGGAIVASSVALASGFGVLALSGFGVNFAMGVCTAMIVLAAMLIDLIVLPWVLRSVAPTSNSI